MRKILSFTFLLVFVSQLRASPPIGAGQKQPSMGMVVVSTDYNSAEKVTTLHLVNTSQKEVTAFYVAYVVHLPNGTTTPANITFAGVDFMFKLLRGEHGILPGGSFDYGISGQAGPVEVTGIDTLVYADGTAETQRDEHVQQVIDSRKGRAMAIERVNEVIASVLTNPQDSHPTATVLARLQELDKAVQESKTALPEKGGLDSGLQTAIQSLSTSARVSSEEADLRDLMRKNTDEKAMLIRHSELVKEVRQ